MPRDTPLSVRDEILHCAHPPLEFRKDEAVQRCADSLATLLVSNCVPKILAAFNLTPGLPKNHMDIPGYGSCVLRGLQVPYYRKPEVHSLFPWPSRVRVHRQPKKTSLLPLLITAQRNWIDIRHYDVISERNSFRKIAMNNENYVVGVQRIGRTLFLRRHDERHVDRNNVGYRFERMCRPAYRLDAQFYLMVERSIGNLRTLITAETDAVCEQTKQPLELKSRLRTNKINQPLDCWLQAFLG